MLHNLTGGDWGDAFAPRPGGASFTLPLLAILFIPICLRPARTLPLGTPADVAHNDTLQHRHALFQPAVLLHPRRPLFCHLDRPRLQTRCACRRDVPRNRALSAAGLILYLWTMTHAGTDWIMSRDIDFYSTAFGFILTVGQTLSALAFAILLFAALLRRPPRPVKLPRTLLLNDLGTLLQTLVILWTYVAFMQLLVIWMGNSREDNTWYLSARLGRRENFLARGSSGLLILFHFFIPFYLLLFRGAKQNLPALAATAWMLLLSHVARTILAGRPLRPRGPRSSTPHWLDLAAFVALAGLWLCLLPLDFASVNPRRAARPLPEGAAAHD